MKSIIALTVAAFTLVGCGGGGGLSPTSQNVGFLPSNFAATLDDATNQVVLTIDGVEVARLDETGDIGEFTLYEDGVSDRLAFYAETISGDGAVFVVSSPTADLGLAAVRFTRLGETVLPSGGSATFNGAYAGILVSLAVPALEVQDVFAGDVQLIADFASASISGEITNRASFGGPSDDVLLLPTAITSAGAFSGPTTGGSFPGAGNSAFSGFYDGLFVGDTGNEIVGGLRITHVSGGVASFEAGGFVAAE